MDIIDLQSQPEHIDTLARWHHTEWSYLNPGSTLDDRIDKMQAYLSPDLIPSTFIAIENGSVLGSAALVENDMETRPDLSPWLASVYVAAQHRNRCIGSRLVRHVMDRASGEHSALFLFTPDKVSFYQRLGWSRLEDTDFMSHPVTIMKKTLGQDQKR